MSFLRRLLGLSDSTAEADAARDEAEAVAQREADEAAAAEAAAAEAAAATGVPCPYCGALIDPPPERNRRCPQCRQQVVVRRVDGRLTLLTEAAVPIFEAGRRRTLDEQRWTAARRDWLRLARRINAPAERRARLESAPISAAVVTQSKALYLGAAERAVKAARRARRWGDVAQLRREQARALHDEAGNPAPPPEAIDALYREGMTASLRALEPLSREVELVSSGCCAICRADEGATYPLAAEVRAARLPHVGCPEGLCGCDWWPTLTDSPRRKRRTKPTAPAA